MLCIAANDAAVPRFAVVPRPPPPVNLFSCLFLINSLRSPLKTSYLPCFCHVIWSHKSCIYTTMLWWSVIGRPFVKLFALCYRTVVSACLSVMLVYYGQTIAWIKMSLWYGGRPRPSPHCVRWGPSSLAPRKGHISPPLFGTCLLWPNGRPSR